MRHIIAVAVTLTLTVSKLNADPTSEVLEKTNVSLSLHEQIETSASEIFLEDVAECQCADSSVCDGLAGIRLMQSLAPGVAIRLSQNTIRDIVAIEVKEISVNFIGHDSVNIVSAVYIVGQEEIEHRFSQRLSEIGHGWETMRFRIKRLRLFDKIVSRGDGFKILIPALDGPREDAVRTLSESVGGWLIVDAHVQDRDWTQPFRLHAQIELELLTPVAAKDLERGSVIETGDIRNNWLKSNRFALAEHSTVNDIVGKELSRRIRANEPLRRSMLKKPIIITRGKVVKVRIDQGGIALSSDAKSLQSGAVGDEIEVQIIPTKKKLSARILDAETVLGKM